MRYRIKRPPTTIQGEIKLEGSKSVSNRALIIRALSGKDCVLENLSPGEDTKVLEKLLAEMPAKMDVGHAGTSFRFLTAYLAITEGEWVLTGSDRIRERPIAPLVDALKSLGADITYMEKDGYAPLVIKGKPLAGGTITIPGNISSQFISALLMIGPYLEGGLAVELEGEISSGPYINLTRQVMAQFGVLTYWEEVLEVGEQQYEAPSKFTVEGDWSAASYFYSIMALAGKGELKILGLRPISEQGDSIVQSIYDGFGVISSFEENELLIETEMEADVDEFFHDFTDCPDIAQTLVVTCAGIGLPSTFSGLESLEHKETDRTAALQSELEKFGAVFKQDADGDWELETGVHFAGGVTEVATYEDHRMAMAFAPLAMVLPAVIIENPEVVAKSFPSYWEVLESLGFEIEELED